VFLAAGLFTALIVHFNWLCDDAFISFRFSKNLAEGHGLTFNPGVESPVEGYSNFLWVLWLALFEAAGLNIGWAARATSMACALILFGLLARQLHQVIGSRPGVLFLALLFPATLPPLALWSSSGLATLPFALAVFTSLLLLLGSGPRPRWLLAAMCAALATLLRADGAWWVGWIVLATLTQAWRQRSRPLAGAALGTGLIAAAVVVLHVLWRLSYYGEWLPNTARVKVDIGWVILERGVMYIATYLVAFPACLLVLLLAFPLGRGLRTSLVLPSAIMIAATLVYAVLVGGDFMAMGRFLVPALPFLALLYGLLVERLARFAGAVPLPAVALASICAGLSLLAAANVSFLPVAVRQRLDFRWSADRYRTEIEQWRMMCQNQEQWAGLGRALAQHTQAGESLITGTIGCVGYYSDLILHDPFGLVNQEAFKEEEGEKAERKTPGHGRRVPLVTFLEKHPTYLDAELATQAQPYASLPPYLRPGGPYRDQARPEWIPLQGIKGVPEGWVLRLVHNKKARRSHSSSR
jgi:arabinofuranosyltransferase